MIVVQSFSRGLSSIRAPSPSVRLSITQASAFPGGPLLVVEYPPPGDDPAGRDVWCDAEHRDWKAGRELSLLVRSDHPLRLSVSFFDRNAVAYTSWSDLPGVRWNTVRIPLDRIRPNPFFQAPDADTRAPLDVSDVAGIGIAPQDRSGGRLLVGRIVVTG